VAFRLLGEQALKNISRTVVVYEVLLDGAPKAAAGKPRPAPRSISTKRTARVQPPPRRERPAWLLVVALRPRCPLAIGAIAHLVATQLLPSRPSGASRDRHTVGHAGRDRHGSCARHRAGANRRRSDLARPPPTPMPRSPASPRARLRPRSPPRRPSRSAAMSAPRPTPRRRWRRCRPAGRRRAVTPSIAVLPPPLCQVLDALPAKTIEVANDAAAPRLAVGGDRGVYHDGDHLLVSASAPAAYDGYLYVDYVDSGEKLVAHLLPNDLRPDNHVIAGQQIAIGTLPQEVARYGFRPPHGTNLVIVVSTRHPLFDAPVSKWSELAQYLPRLAQALQAQPDALVAYGTVIGKP
jgi:hypothetical protein